MVKAITNETAKAIFTVTGIGEINSPRIPVIKKSGAKAIIVVTVPDVSAILIARTAYK